MYLRKLLITLICIPLFAQGLLTSTPAEIEAKARDAAKLRAMIEAAPKLPLEQTDLEIKLPEGQELGMVSWVARDPKTGVVWLLQRGEKADPVIAVDKQGRVLHSFGKGLYKIPHALRLDAEGNVWTRFPSWGERIRSSWVQMGRYGQESNRSMSQPDLPAGWSSWTARPARSWATCP